MESSCSHVLCVINVSDKCFLPVCTVNDDVCDVICASCQLCHDVCGWRTVIVEAQKCLCNIIFNSVEAQRICRYYTCTFFCPVCVTFYVYLWLTAPPPPKEGA